MKHTILLAIFLMSFNSPNFGRENLTPRLFSVDTKYGLQFGATSGGDTLLHAEFREGELKLINHHLYLSAYKRNALWNQEGQVVYPISERQLINVDELFFTQELIVPISAIYHYTEVYNSNTGKKKTIPDNLKRMKILNVSDGIFALVEENGFWGFLDRELNWILKPDQYKKHSSHVYLGVIEASLDGKYGCFNLHNEILVPFEYDSIVTLSDPLIALKKGTKWGYYDENNDTYSSDFIFDSRPRGVGSHFVLGEINNEKYLYAKKGFKKTFAHPIDACRTLTVQNRSYYFPRYNEKVGLLSSDSSITLPIKYERIDFQKFADAFLVKEEKYYSVISTEGEIISKDFADEFFNGGSLSGYRATNIRKTSIVLKDSKKGLIDAFGNVILEAEFDKVPYRPMKDSLYLVRYDGKARVFDKETDQFLNIEFESARNYFNQVLLVQKDSVYQFYTVDLEPVSESVFDEVKLENGFFIVSKDAKKGVVNKNGEIITEPNYDDLLMSRENGYFQAKRNDESVLINLKGKEILTDFTVADTHCNDSLFTFKRDKKRGLIDLDGDVICEPVYDYIFINCNDELSAVKLNDKYGYINKRGDLVIPLKFGDAREFKKGLALVADEKYGKLYWINEKGERWER